MSINACAVKYTKPPMCGHRCIARSDTTITLWQKDHPGCMLKCVQLKICHYINYNYDTGQCDLDLDKCESLIPSVGVTLNVFGAARDNCIHWGPRQQHGRVAVELQEQGYVMYLAWIATDDTFNNPTVRIADPRKQNTLLSRNYPTDRRTILHHDGDVFSYHYGTPF